MPLPSLKLGWRNPRPNDFQSEDLRPLRDLFGNLQHFMTWPYVGLRFDGTMQLTATLAGIPFDTYSGAASPFVPGDPFKLYSGAPSAFVQVPRDFDTWMLFGSASALTAGGVAADIFTLAWRVNSVNDVQMTHMTGSGASRVSLPIMRPVRKGDIIDVAAASNNLAEDLDVAEAWMIFLPLA